MPFTFTAGKIEPPKQFFVPPGRYKLRIIEAKEDSHTDGSDMLKVTFRTILPDGSDGPNFKENFFFTPKAFWKIDQFLSACGKHPGEGAAVNIDATETIGWECEAELKVREFTGTKGDKIKTNEVASFIIDEFA